MRMTSVLLLLGAAMLTSCTADHPISATGQVDCPREIAVKQTLESAHTEWDSYIDDTPVQLRAVSIFDGHPSERSALVPDEESTINGCLVSKWNLVNDNTHRYWIVCYYDNTQVVLTRPISASVSLCQVTSNPSITVGGQPSIVEVTLE